MFAYCLNKNRRLLGDEAQNIQSSKKQSVAYKSYLAERDSLHRQYVVKNPQGGDATVVDAFGNHLPQYTDQAKFTEGLSGLNSRYSSAVDEEKQHTLEFQNFIRNRTDIDLCLYDGPLPKQCTVYHADVILPVLSPKIPDTVIRNVPFSRQGILGYRKWIHPILPLSGEFVAVFAENLRILNKMLQEIICNPLVRDYLDLYEFDRLQLIERHAEKDIFLVPKSVPTGNGTVKFIIKDQQAFSEGMGSLVEKHEHIINAYNNYMDEVFLIPVYTFSMDQVGGAVDGNQMSVLFDFIE